MVPTTKTTLDVVHKDDCWAEHVHTLSCSSKGLLLWRYQKCSLRI